MDSGQGLEQQELGGGAPPDPGDAAGNQGSLLGKATPSFLGIKVAPVFPDVVRDGNTEDFLSYSSDKTSAVTYFLPPLHRCHLAILCESAWLAGWQTGPELWRSHPQRSRKERGPEGHWASTVCPWRAGPRMCDHSLLVSSTALQYDYCHFRDEQTEAQRGCVCPRILSQAVQLERGQACICTKICQPPKGEPFPQNSGSFFMPSDTPKHGNSDTGCFPRTGTAPGIKV